ncbi:type IV pilin protein [Candidatus Avelusimicrobium facis]|uniref:type IV pilin protein n=1 Tax=Candidatus Avelusimicrobium facis TaxID=3416203 RepID=UPI003D0EBC62
MKNRFTGRLGGFTLIELLVVVLIIGLLSAVALPQYDKAVLKSRVATGFAQLAALDQAQTAYYLANGTYATEVEALGSGVPQVGCKVNDSSSVVYCYRFASDSATKDRVRLEFYGRLYSGEKLWVCLAKKGDEAAQRICQSYYQQWRGTEAPREGESGYIYYYGAPHL